MLIFIKKILSRCLFLYLAAFLLICATVNKREVTMQMLNHLNGADEEVLSYAQGGPRPLTQTLIRARLLYKNILDLYPKSISATSSVGYVNYLMGYPDRAIRWYEKAAALNNNYFGIYYNLGILYLKESRLSKAKEAFQKALETKPGRMLNYPTYVDPNLPIASDIKQPEARMEGLQRSYQICFLSLIKINERLKNYTEMKETILLASQQGYLAERETYYYLGKAYYGLNDDNKAVQFFLKTVGQDSGYRDANNYLAGLMVRFGKQREAKIFRLKENFEPEADDKPERELYYIHPLRLIDQTHNEVIVL